MRLSFSCWELNRINCVCVYVYRWIVQAMKHELKIRAGDMPPQDIHQMSPSDIKQLLLDVLQPQHIARSSSNTQRHAFCSFSYKLCLKTLVFIFMSSPNK